MDRREALLMTAQIMGGTIVGSSLFLSSCKRNEEKLFLISENDVQLLDEIGETILPESDQSPGAKAANIGSFMKTIVKDCYTEEDTQVFVSGLIQNDKEAQAMFDNRFMDLIMSQRVKLLGEIQIEANQVTEDEHTHYYTMIKQLCIWGYFSSQVGATKALRYNPIPGRYDACVEYNSEESAWS